MDDQAVWDALLERWQSWQSPSWWKPIKQSELTQALGWPAQRVHAAVESHIQAGLVSVHAGISARSEPMYALTEAGLRVAGKAYYDLYASQNPGVLDAMGRVD